MEGRRVPQGHRAAAAQTGARVNGDGTVGQLAVAQGAVQLRGAHRAGQIAGHIGKDGIRRRRQLLARQQRDKIIAAVGLHQQMQPVAAAEERARAEIHQHSEQPVAHGDRRVGDWPDDHVAAGVGIIHLHFEIIIPIGRTAVEQELALIGEGGALGGGLMHTNQKRRDDEKRAEFGYHKRFEIRFVYRTFIKRFGHENSTPKWFLLLSRYRENRGGGKPARIDRNSQIENAASPSWRRLRTSRPSFGSVSVPVRPCARPNAASFLAAIYNNTQRQNSIPLPAQSRSGRYCRPRAPTRRPHAPTAKNEIFCAEGLRIGETFELDARTP